MTYCLAKGIQLNALMIYMRKEYLKSRYMHMYNRFNLLYIWNQYILNQLYSRKKNKKYTKNSYYQHLDNNNLIIKIGRGPE